MGLVISITLIALAGRLVILSQPVNSDTAMFVYMGKLVSEGGRIGIDLVDNKLPTVGLLMSGPYALLGKAWWAYALLGLAMTGVSSIMLARTARRCLGESAALPVGLASALWLNFPPLVYGHLQLETIQILFTTLAGCAAMELIAQRGWRSAVLIGLCASIAMWAKPTAGAVVVAAVGAILFGTAWNWRARFTSIAWIAVGGLIPSIVCAGLLWSLGMIEPLPATVAQIRDYASHSTAKWADAIKPLFVLAVLMFPAVVWAYVFRRDAIPSERRGAMTLFIVGWLLMETVAVVMQRRMYAYHFLVLAPPASLVLGLFLRTPRFASIGFALGPVALLSAIFTCQMFCFPERALRMQNVIAWLDVHARPQDAVWMDDYPQLMVETNLRPGSRVPLTFLFGNSDMAPLHFSSIILDDLRTRKPEWVVLYQDVGKYIDFYRHHMVEIAEFPERGRNFEKAWRDIDGYVRSHYVVAERVDGMDILKRAEAISHATP